MLIGESPGDRHAPWGIRRVSHSQISVLAR
jgi:hypothetical protein